MLEAFKDIVPDICAFGTHSLRSGQVTNATNACVPGRLFKRLGRWSSEFAKDGYVKDSFLTSISKANRYISFLVRNAFSFILISFSWSCPRDRCLWGTAGLGFSS